MLMSRLPIAAKLSGAGVKKVYESTPFEISFSQLPRHSPLFQETFNLDLNLDLGH